jgi:hypothetical protein
MEINQNMASSAKQFVKEMEIELSKAKEKLEKEMSKYHTLGIIPKVQIIDAQMSLLACRLYLSNLKMKLDIEQYSFMVSSLKKLNKFKGSK